MNTKRRTILEKDKGVMTITQAKAFVKQGGSVVDTLLQKAVDDANHWMWKHHDNIVVIDIEHRIQSPVAGEAIASVLVHFTCPISFIGR